eukprot:TRINITY_DN25833_c0_g1_i1.p1 TRINITY_DN25833_c0_g1~~TRINITY_DN25833_c0_g1_i1.p1  ORF type:complete len:147 (+),score=44.30 TRINITY_DN25833_c0_g1_i1:93-533(+)
MSISLFFFLMIRRPPRSTLSSSSAASDVYKRQVLDVRDVNEVAAAKGGVTVPGAVHAALNMDGIPQRVQPTSVDQYAQTLIDAGVELNPQSHASPFIVHCSGGGRAAKVVGFLKELGFEAVNGGSPDDVRSCWEQVQARQREQDRA